MFVGTLFHVLSTGRMTIKLMQNNHNFRGTLMIRECQVAFIVARIFPSTTSPMDIVKPSVGGFI